MQSESMFAQIGFNIVATASIFACLAVSFKLIFKSTGFFNIAHASTVTLGAYLTHALLSLGLVLSVSIALGGIMAGVFGYLSYRYGYRRLLASNVPGWQLLVASLGLYLVVQNLISLAFGDDVIVLAHIDEVYALPGIGVRATLPQLMVVGCSLFFLSSVAWFLNWTTLGKKVVAVWVDPVLSEIYGLNRERVIGVCFLLGSLLAAFIGIFLGIDTNLTPTMGFGWLIYAIISMILAGMGNEVRHILFGALLLATVQHLAIYNFGNRWVDPVSFLVMVIFVMLRPGGFSNVRMYKLEI